MAALFVFLFGVAFARAGATYALARGACNVGSRHTALLQRPGVARAEGAVRRYGAPVVTLCFLTVGVQTAVHLAAGSLRMPLRRYLPALALGAVGVGDGLPHHRFRGLRRRGGRSRRVTGCVRSS